MRTVDLGAIDEQLDDIAAEREELVEAALPWLRLLVEIRAGAAGEWKRDAACAGEDINVFFVERGQPLDRARDLCATCPVIDACAEWAIDAGPELHGFAAGLTPADRTKMRRADAA